MKLFENIAYYAGAAYALFKDTFRGFGRPEWIFCGIMIFVFTGLFGSIYYRYAYMTEVTECYKVVSVGGCGRGGMCGVMLENGMKALAYLPVVGENICVNVLVAKP